MNISIIIPTIHRSQDLKRCFDCLMLQTKKCYAIHILDHSIDIKTEKLCVEYADKLPIIYTKRIINSWAQARNQGIQQLSSDTDLVMFIDDDTSFESDFFSAIINFFEHHPWANWWLCNIYSPWRKINLAKKIGFFLLTGSTRYTEQFVTSWWFNAMFLQQPTIIKFIQRCSGCAMVFRKSVINEWFRFPENFLKYSLMEDVFLSYEIHTQYPDSLFYIPNAKITHHESSVGRIASEEKIRQQVIHRFLFVKKFKLSYIWYLWTILNLMLLDIMQYKNIKVISEYCKSLIFVYKNYKKLDINNSRRNGFIFKHSKF